MLLNNSVFLSIFAEIFVILLFLKRVYNLKDKEWLKREYIVR